MGLRSLPYRWPLGKAFLLPQLLNRAKADLHCKALGYKCRNTSHRWRGSSSYSKERTNNLVFRVLKDPLREQPIILDLKPGILELVLQQQTCAEAFQIGRMNCDGCTHSIMQFPLFQFAITGRGEGKHLGASWFLAAFLLMTHTSSATIPLFSAKDSLHLKWSQAALPDKGNKQCSEFSCCHCLTVGLFLTEPLTIIFSLLKKFWKAVTFSQKFLADIIPMPAAKHQDTSMLGPPVPLRMQSAFHLWCGKTFFVFAISHWDCLKHDQGFKRLQQSLR